MVERDGKEVRFDAHGLVPAIVQEARTGEVLMLAYMNREALEKTKQTGTAWFYSRSRNRLWQKGESSGHVQRVRQILTDCDQDAVLLRVEQEGAGACHEGYFSCFHYGVDGSAEVTAPIAFDPQSVYGEDESVVGTKEGGTQAGSDAVQGDFQDRTEEAVERILEHLYQVIASRKARPKEGSYTTYLFSEGIDKILKKVGEETAEVLIAGKGGDNEGLVMESADLIYHLLVLFVEAGVSPDAVWKELGKRRGGGGSEDTPPGK